MSDSLSLSLFGEIMGKQSHLGVMNESTTLAVWRKITGRGIFEALDDGLILSVSPSAHTPTPSSLKQANPYRLARSIMANDQRKRRMELNGLTAGVVE